MKNKTTWSATETQDPLKDIQDFHNTIMASFVSPEIFILPACINTQLENLEKRWKEGQNK